MVRYRCSSTNLGPWRGRPPTGCRCERVDEIYIYRVDDGRIIEVWGIEDTRSRERQLGLKRARPDGNLATNLSATEGNSEQLMRL